MEYSKQEVVGIFVEHEPGRAERILEIAHHVDITGGRITLSQQECLPPVSVLGHINHHHGMAILVIAGTVDGGIHENITRQHVFQPSLLHLSAERVCAYHTIHISHKSLKCLARRATAIVHRLAVHILEMNFTILSCIEQILSTQAHANIGALLFVR